MNPSVNKSQSVSPVSLPIAVRVYPVAAGVQDHPTLSRKFWRLSNQILVIDTETRVDEAQALTFGSYQALLYGRAVEEGLFYGTGLSATELRTLKRYVRERKPNVHHGGVKELRLLSLREFLKELFIDAYKGRCLLVAFNHPFDLSRIAHDFAKARGRYAGGFSLGLWTYVDKNGRECRDPHRPRIAIKHIDSKRSLIGFTARVAPDEEDLIPEDGTTAKPKKGYKFRGHFLDLRTLAFALTDRGYTLASACEAFQVENPKQSASEHGKISKKYIDYNRRDVRATTELTGKLLEEYERHPISLQVTKAFSPASIGKSYLREMGIEPVLRRQPDFPIRYIGYAQSAFYGGRTSAHIRKVAIPVVYTDFLSMYPTVNSLMGLWRFVIAREIRVLKHCDTEIQRFLERLSPGYLFAPATWKQLPAFVRVIPNDDVLPSRSKYSLESNDWQVALNHLSGIDGDPRNGLWFSLPDVVASRLLTGRVPRIVEAFRIEPYGTLEKLLPIKLRNAIPVDPRTQDFFKVVIEQRKLLDSRTDLTPAEKKRLNKALKVLANATSYGIYAEMNRQESEKKVRATCQGIDPEPYSCNVLHPEVPGEYCFPPLASLITGAARLMLALLEHSVTHLGGTYAMEDTDSMAIVANQTGGLVPCPDGPYRMRDGKRAVKALSWKQVDGLAKLFEPLNPYDRNAIPGSVLKIEDDNWDPATKRQRQLYCVAISAKRYALFVKDRDGRPALLREGHNNNEDRWSEHGLGHVLNPTDPTSEDREWIAKVWLNIVRRVLDLPTEPVGFEHLPAVGRITVSSPAVAKPLENLNEGKKYPDQIKPFNFLLSCHVRQFGHPLGADPEHFHLISPYEVDPRKWLKKKWIDEYSGVEYQITTSGHTGNRWTARVKTYGELLEEYEFHPESKCADSNGKACDRQTVGFLQRRQIGIDQIKYIGKESNSLEDVESGLVHSAQNAYTEYVDRRRDEWTTKVQPALKKAPLIVLVEECRGRLSRRAIIDLRAGRSRPHRRNQELLKSILRKLGIV